LNDYFNFYTLKRHTSPLTLLKYLANFARSMVFDVTAEWK